jgi:hypothetical protein
VSGVRYQGLGLRLGNIDFGHTEGAEKDFASVFPCAPCGQAFYRSLDGQTPSRKRTGRFLNSFGWRRGTLTSIMRATRNGAA